VAITAIDQPGAYIHRIRADYDVANDRWQYNVEFRWYDEDGPHNYHAILEDVDGAYAQTTENVINGAIATFNTFVGA